MQTDTQSLDSSHTQLGTVPVDYSYRSSPFELRQDDFELNQTKDKNRLVNYSLEL